MIRETTTHGRSKHCLADALSSHHFNLSRAIREVIMKAPFYAHEAGKNAGDALIQAWFTPPHRDTAHEMHCGCQRPDLVRLKSDW